jgi:hypothetical protein
MKCLDPILAPISPSLLVLVLALAGCSDDGLAPPQDTDAASTAGSGGPVTTGGETGTSNGTTASDEGSAGPSDDSTGGPGTTGTGGDSGSGSDDGTTGEGPTNACETPDECVLVNDCCQCAAAHMDDEIPECPMECDQPMCDALGIPDIEVVCEDGECGLEPHDCSGLVVCASLPPECPEGTLPEVGNGGGGGGCWTGLCIPVEACDPLPGCEFCDADEACVETASQLGTSYSCRPLPDECGGVPTCECMPPDTCTAPFDACMDVDGAVQCSCLAC